MRLVAKAVENLGPPRLMAGCAGFAQYLPQILKLKKSKLQNYLTGDEMLVVCGSINAITMEQVEHAAEHGFVIVELSPEQKLTRSAC